MNLVRPKIYDVNDSLFILPPLYCCVLPFKKLQQNETMKSNQTLQEDVENAIKWEPLMHAAEIGVTAKEGVVTLTGKVDSYAKKTEAENATKRVLGVKAIVENIEVHFANSWDKDDNEIATEVLNAFKLSWEVPDDKLMVKVENGWVSLSGELPWNYQRETAKRLAGNCQGVKGVINNMTIKSESQNTIEKRLIERALNSNWSIADEEIDVEVDGTTVTLTGTVSSWYQKDEAGRIAWNTPGIWNVKNELEVDYYYMLVD